MKIETQRLLIRNVKTEDAKPFAKMAADGSLNDCGFDRDCGSWITQWTAEAKDFVLRDDPNMDYLAYTITLKDGALVVGSVGCSYYEDFQEIGITYFVGAQYRNNGYAVEAVRAYTEYFLNHYHAKRMIATVRDENIPSWKVIEKAGFTLNEKRMYKDLNDDDEKLYRFYEIRNENQKSEFEEMWTMKLKNILIVVKDIEKSKQFYHDLFGLDMILDNDGNMILTEGLVLQDEKVWKKFLDKDIIPKNNSCELYFEEQNIEAFIENLENLYPGVQYVNRLMTHSWGQKVIRFYDLDGNLIEVGTPM